MYDLSDLFRYGGLSALGLALAATGLPANAAVTAPQQSNVLTFVGAAGAAAAAQPDRRAPRERGETRRGNGDRAQSRQQRRQADRQQARQERRQERRATRDKGVREQRQRARQARQEARQQQRRAERRADRRTERRTERRADRRAERRADRRAERRADRRADRRETRREVRREARREARRDVRRDQRRAYRQAERRAERRFERREARRDARRWNRAWRNNNRYNWHRYRAQNRRLYSLGRYYAPYRNYNYRRLSIGFTLGSVFFGNRYWINDPWTYRLPEVYGPYRWVRYYDDVILVNTHTGEVVDVIYDFFW